MTIGIYRLVFEGTNKCYIGQSVHIEERYLSHITSFRNNTCNYKMLEAYKTYGMPTIDIILECDIQELDVAESEAITIFDSVDSGFNILGVSTTGAIQGYSSGRCNSTKDELLCAARLLPDITLSIPKIESMTGVSDSILRKMLNGTRHVWISEEYPELWATILATRGNRKVGSPDGKTRGIAYPKVISPEGLVLEVTNTNKFAREHGLSQGNFYNMLRGMYSQHKGWRLA